REIAMLDRAPPLPLVGQPFREIALAVHLIALPVEVYLVVDIAAGRIAAGRRVLGHDIADIEGIDGCIAGELAGAALVTDTQRATGLDAQRLARAGILFARVIWAGYFVHHLLPHTVSAHRRPSCRTDLFPGRSPFQCAPMPAGSH